MKELLPPCQTEVGCPVLTEVAIGAAADLIAFACAAIHPMATEGYCDAVQYTTTTVEVSGGEA